MTADDVAGDVTMDLRGLTAAWPGTSTPLLVRTEDLQLLSRPQFMPAHPQSVRRASRELQTFVELAVAGFNQGLMQVALGKIAREIIRRQSGRRHARLPDRIVTILSAGRDRSRLGTARQGHAVT